MIYWTKQTIVAFAAGGLLVGGTIPTFQTLATLDLPGLSAPVPSSEAGFTHRAPAKANGTIRAVSIPSDDWDLPQARRARAGELVASRDGLGAPMPLASYSRGRDL